MMNPVKNLEELNEVPQEYVAAVDGNLQLAWILYNRGIKKDEVAEFINPDLYQPTNPFDFPGIEKAAGIIQKAREKGQKICIYGDYDVDGITATALLVSALRLLGAYVSYRIPDRFKEGYGLNESTVKEIAEEGVDILITCDCGISNYDEIVLAKNLGVRVIVTDHHLMPDKLPPADAIVTSQKLSPEHKARNVPGVGVAFFLALVLLSKYNLKEKVEDFLDLVALGVIGDVVPLKGENRFFVQKGLPRIIRGNRIGLRVLLKKAQLHNKDITEEDIAFQICPRLNSAGRMKNAALAVELLLTNDGAKAEEIADFLEELNSQRQSIGDNILQEAERMITADDKKPIVLFQSHWHEGIIGIIAGRLVEKYQVPAVLMTQREDGNTVVGSARSISGLHIREALEECEQYLKKYGGHSGAAGFSLLRENLTAFTGEVQKVLEDKLKTIQNDSTVHYDLVMPFDKINNKLFHKIRLLAPFGEGWPQPLFYCNGVSVLSSRPTTNERHLRLILEHNNKSVPAIYWWGGNVALNKEVDLVYKISLNRWNDKEEIQLVVDKIIEIPTASIRKKSRVEKIIDRRRWRELGGEFPSFDNAVYFHEGNHLKGIQSDNVYDRYSLTSSPCLVLLSCPPSSGVFKEVISLVNSRVVVLAFSLPKPLSLSDCIKKVMGCIKYLVTESKGKTSIFEIAVLTGFTELFCIETIKFLRNIGLLEVIMRENGCLLLKIKRSKAKNLSPPAKLKKLVEEMNAFQRFMGTAEVEVLKKQII